MNEAADATWARGQTFGLRSWLKTGPANSHPRGSLAAAETARCGLPLLVCGAIVGALLMSGCGDQESTRRKEDPAATVPAPAIHPVRFDEVTSSTGVRSIYDNGEASGNRSIVESLGGGVAIIDYDLDGRLDLFFPTGGGLQEGKPLTGQPHALWRQGTGFQFHNCSQLALLPEPPTYTHGVTAGDFDQDGFQDLLVTGYGGLQLLRNQGDGTWVDCTAECGLADDQWSSSAAWVDVDNDGDLDLYVCHYVDWSWDNHPTCPAAVEGEIDICSPNDFMPLTDVLYLNDGAGRFSPAVEEVGLQPGGKGLGVVAAHLNDDPWVDLYVANDTRNNFLYLNTEAGILREVGLVSGTAVDDNGTPNGSMGLAVFDYDRDLLPDLWVTNYENETCALYRNAGDGNFLWATEVAGINMLGKLFVSFGTVPGDFDGDGDEDLAVANGHIMLHPRNANLAQESLLLINQRDDPRSGVVQGRFQRAELPAEDYFSQPKRGRGLAVADLDADGDLDLVFTNIREPAAILANRTKPLGESFQLRLVGRSSNRDAIGTRVIVQTNQGSYSRQVIGGGSYLSQSSYTLHWGIPSGEVVETIQIFWPSGLQQELSGDRFPTGQTHLVIEPRGSTEPAE